MVLKVSKLKNIILYFIVFYMLNKCFFDYYIPPCKYLFYTVLFVGSFISIAKLLLNRNFRVIPIFYFIYISVVICNGFLLSNDDQRPVGFMEYIIYPLFLFAFLFYIDEKLDFYRFMRFIMICGGVLSLIAIFESITKTSIIPDTEKKIYIYYDGTSSYRSAGFIGSPMILAVILGVILIVTFYFYHFEKKKEYQLLMLLLVIGIFVTGSRAPLVCSIAGILLMFYKLGQYKMIGQKTANLLLLSFLFSLLLVIILYAFPNIHTGVVFIDNTISRFSSTFNFSSEWGNVERLNRWEYYLNVFTKNPITGIGIATTSAEVASNMNVTAHGITTESGVLARLVETGLCGTISYYAFFFSAVNIALNNMRKYVKNKQYWYFMLIGIIALYLIEDVVLQITIDIFGEFIVLLFIALSIRFSEKFIRIKIYEYNNFT